MIDLGWFYLLYLLAMLNHYRLTRELFVIENHELSSNYFTEILAAFFWWFAPIYHLAKIPKE